MKRRATAEELFDRTLKHPKLARDFLRRYLRAPGELASIIDEIVTGDTIAQFDKLPLGAAVASREAFPDFDRALLLTLRRITILCDLVRQVSDEDRDAVFSEVYSRGFVAVSHHLTIVAFRALPPDVLGRLDDRAYFRVMCDPGEVGLSAWADFSRRVREGVTAYSAQKIMEKAAERPTTPNRYTVERLDVD